MTMTLYESLVYHHQHHMKKTGPHIIPTHNTLSNKFTKYETIMLVVDISFLLK